MRKNTGVVHITDRDTFYRHLGLHFLLTASSPLGLLELMATQWAML